MWNKESEEWGVDGWMDGGSEGGRTATADGGEDPLLTNTLIIHVEKKKTMYEGRQDDAGWATTTV